MNKTEELKEKIEKLDLYPTVVPSEFHYKENPSLKHWQDIKKSKLLDLIKQSNREAVESERKNLLRVIKSLPLCNICGSGQTIEKYFNSLEKGTNNE